MTKPMKDANVKIYGSVYFSRLMGQCDDYLANYRSRNHHIKTYLQAYNEIMQRRLKQDEVMNKIQAIYYHLSDKRQMGRFGKYLLDKKITENERSIYKIFEQIFRNRIALVSLCTIEKYENIIKLYEGWKV